MALLELGLGLKVWSERGSSFRSVVGSVGLSAYVLVGVERFGEPLQAKVVATCARQGRRPSGRFGFLAWRGAREDALGCCSWLGREGVAGGNIPLEGVPEDGCSCRLQAGGNFPQQTKELPGKALFV
jgi:hypothetical protein